MVFLISAGRQTVKPPVGCQGYLTRRQAAIQLGLRSEYKIRQFEREGRLHAVRGRMGTAFYPEAEVLGLRSQLDGTPCPAPGRWTDADLILLLRQPTSEGRPRSPVDLVAEAKITIARAERVYRFWLKGDGALATRAPCAAGLLPTPADRPGAGRQPVGEQPAAPPASDKDAADERRSATRLAHDGLVRSLRHPDPRIRAQAFTKLKDSPRL
jgi:hypothetical protein